MLHSWLTDPSGFRIVLRDAKRYDTYETRQFDLPLNSTFPIGRASNSVTKKALMAAPHNAFIDSPVISRQHAVLSANTTSGVPEVYISDQGSMHGTMLNGQRLPPKTPTKLKYGDELQFGTDVNRNEGECPRLPLTNTKLTCYTEFFVARQYVFESQLSRPFSLGFTVPDAESEDEEVERRGSEADPFVIDDEDMVAEQAGQDNEAETTMFVDALQPEQPLKSPAFAQELYFESALRTTVVDESYDEGKKDAEVPATDPTRQGQEELVSPDSNPHGVDDHDRVVGTDFASESGSIDSSDIDSESESEIQKSDDEIDEAEYSEPLTSVTQDAKYPNSDAVSANGDEAPPLPPRPACVHTSWSNLSYPSFGQTAAQNWYSDDTSQANYVGTNFGDRPCLFSPPPPASSEPVDVQIAMSLVQETDSLFRAHGLQTHPSVLPSYVDAVTPQQPGRRTKVSIEEIVDEQPPTQESVKSLKRKADVLEEVVVAQEEVYRASAPVVEQTISDSTIQAPVDDCSATQNAAAISQRPKKVPRSILKRALNKATYPLLGATGAVVSFALLSTLPDTFFM